MASSLLRWIGRTYEAEGDHGAAFDCLEVAEAVAEAYDSGPDLAHALNCRGILHFRLGDLERAEALYLKARGIARRHGEDKLVAMVDQNLGNVSNVRGDHQVAHKRYLRSLHGYRRLGLKEYVGPLLTNIGRVHTDVGAWHAAEAVFRLAEASCEQSENVLHLILIKVNETRLHLARGQFGHANAACLRAEELSRNAGEDRWLGEIHKHRGMILLRTNRPGSAEASLVAALAEAQRLEDPLLEAEIRNEMAALFRAQRRHREMLECLDQAHRAFSRLRARGELADVERQIARLEASFEGIVREWGDSIESTDRYTQGHCVRVANLACDLARAAGLTDGELTWFRMGALLHDVGKVSVPPEILNKTGRLTEKEWQIMRRHPERGVELLAEVEFPWDIRPMVLHHHERWDGSGYPYGLAGSDIPLAARILCVADVFDALTTTRSYRRAFSAPAALEIMEADVGRLFDPELFRLFRELTEVHLPATSVGPALAAAAPGAGYAFASAVLGPLVRRPPVFAVA
ncbi:MAG: HD domain-containing protein [Gemmatimonadetes bacterium]|nr:HD domain-containing protein [Gemmatimonadota bacterium]